MSLINLVTHEQYGNCVILVWSSKEESGKKREVGHVNALP